jgi:hypothetical protein
MNSVSSWIFNLMLWGAIVTLAVLIYDKIDPGFLASSANAMTALIAIGVVVVVSALWPRY